jgi:hypothetical protein
MRTAEEVALTNAPTMATTFKKLDNRNQEEYYTGK